MKNKLQILFLSVVVLTAVPAVLLFTGCGAMQGALLTSTVNTNAVTGVVAANYTPSAVVTGALSTATMVAPLIPPPWGEIAAGLLALATIGLGQYARVKSNQASVIPALIAGVESAANNDAVKTSIQRAATALGVQDTLHALVQTQTNPAGTAPAPATA